MLDIYCECGDDPDLAIVETTEKKTPETLDVRRAHPLYLRGLLPRLIDLRA